VVGVGVRGEGRVSAYEDLDGPRLCLEEEFDRGREPVSSSFGPLRREVVYAGFCSRRGDSLPSGRLGNDMFIDDSRGW
jgi:hypothetical protein